MTNANQRVDDVPDAYAPRGVRRRPPPKYDPEYLVRLGDGIPTLGEMAGTSEEEAWAEDARLVAEAQAYRRERARAVRGLRLGRIERVAHVPAVTPIARSRQSRGKATRTRGSRRSVASSADDDGGGEPEPPRALVGKFRKWWRRRFEELAAFSRGEGA